MKKIIITSLCVVSVLLISIVIYLLCFINKANNAYDKVLDSLNKINLYANKLDIYERGTIDLNANYKGAHGESLPNKFNYNFEIVNKVITFENEGLYSELDLDLELINKIKKIDKKSFEVKKRKIAFNKITQELDVNLINNIFEKKYKKAYIVMNDNSTLYLDNDKITFNNDSITANIGNNEIKIVLGNNKYSLNINNKLKVNAFLDENLYNIILNNNVISLKYSDALYIDFNSPASIYNSLEFKINKNDININKSKLEENDVNPIIRYIDKIERDVLR